MTSTIRAVRARRRWLVVYVAVLILQLIPPMAYYLGGGDRDDERFAWRMFSSTWFARKGCAVGYEDVFVTAPRLDPEAEMRFDAAWMPVLRRRWDWATARIVSHRCRTRRGLIKVRLFDTCGSQTVRVDYPCARGS